jgi:serine protease Do
METNNMVFRHLRLAILAIVVVGGCTPLESTPLPTVTSVAKPSPVYQTATPFLGEAGLPDIASVVEKVLPAVVSVTTQQVQLEFLFQVLVPGAGSGAIIRPDGYIVTNYHVIDSAEDITVTLADGQTFLAEVVGRDPEGDLAVIKIEADGLPTLQFGRSETVRVGDWVIAVGNALGLRGGSSVTIGIVSALGRTILTDPQRSTYLFDTIQTDAAINPGNSGGPLVNLRGELVGINTAVEGSAQSIGFAISSGIAEPTVDELIRLGYVVRPYLGVGTVTLTPSIARQLGAPVTEGVVIDATVPGTPASRAGLERLDIITKLSGELVTGDGMFRRILWQFKPGDTIIVEFVRDGKTLTTEVSLVERPSTAYTGQILAVL